MTISSNFELEKQELEKVLSSGPFSKSQNLAKLLGYVCHQYIAGQSDDLKEYQIAVEALGRSSDFDPASNPIVRVEMHRLRGKLKQYYEREGADHSIQIRLEAGSYSPKFVRQLTSIDTNSISARPSSDAGTNQSASENVPPTKITTDGAAVAEGSQSQRAFLPRGLQFSNHAWSLIALALLVFIGVTAWKLHLLHRNGSHDSIALAANSVPINPVDSEQAVRILCGFNKGNYVDRSGNLWGPDRYFSGGEAADQSQQFIARTLDPTLFQSFRRGDFSYDIPLRPGVYELRLYFSETYFGPGTIDLGTGEGDRVFDVNMNGKPLLTGFDIIADAGSNKAADVRVFKDVMPASDGYLHLQFRRNASNPMINAIEITPSSPGRMQPIRIVAQDNSYTDKDGNVWHPDNYFGGGRHALHSGPVIQTLDPGLYTGERFGNFTYQIPIADGRYSLTLHFAETFFGPDSQGKGKGGVNSRTFDVICNGEPLLRNFDVFKKADGKNSAVIETFHGLRANAQGKLDLEFRPINNYATISAIEVHAEP
jgi:hypothetical protein